MRLIIEMEAERATAVPADHQHLLMGAIYRWLADGDADYARFLHDQGYALEGGNKVYKLYCYSNLRSRSRRIDGPTLWLGPGCVTWAVASPLELFLRNFATGLLAEGVLEVAGAALRIVAARTEATPDFSQGSAAFTCLTPIVASRVRSAEAGEGIEYLRPESETAFSEGVRLNLCRKYRTLYGCDPQDDRLSLEFDRAYLANPARRSTRKVRIKGIDVVGAFAPFRATGSAELLALGWDCGFGEKNGSGFGMVARG